MDFNWKDVKIGLPILDTDIQWLKKAEKAAKRKLEEAADEADADEDGILFPV